MPRDLPKVELRASTAALKRLPIFLEKTDGPVNDMAVVSIVTGGVIYEKTIIIPHTEFDCDALAAVFNSLM